MILKEDISNMSIDALENLLESNKSKYSMQDKIKVLGMIVNKLTLEKIENGEVKSLSELMEDILDEYPNEE